MSLIGIVLFVYFNPFLPLYSMLPCTHCFCYWWLAGYRLWIALETLFGSLSMSLPLGHTSYKAKLESPRSGMKGPAGHWGIYIKKRSPHDSFVVLLTFITLIRAIANANQHLAMIMVK